MNFRPGTEGTFKRLPAEDGGSGGVATVIIEGRMACSELLNSKTMLYWALSQLDLVVFPQLFISVSGN